MAESQIPGTDVIWSLVNNAYAHIGEKLLDKKRFELVAEAYRKTSRSFHDKDHMSSMVFMTEEEFFEFAQALSDPKQAYDLKALLTIAGFYHDAVYAHVDGGVTPEIEKALKFLKPVDESKKVWKLPNDISEVDHRYQLVMDIFGFKPGQVLDPTKGQNEFMSALVAAKSLTGLHEIAQVAAMIEATIPFRTQEKFDELETRLKDADKKYGLKLGNKIEDVMKASVFLANKDVSNFASLDKPTGFERFLNFIQNSWKLIPELTPALRGTDFTPTEYRQALTGMLKFNQMLDDGQSLSVNNIFHNWNDYAAEKAVEMTRSAHTNIETAILYLQTKVASASIVEALAIKTGALGNDKGANTSLVDFVSGVQKHLDDNSKQLDVIKTLRGKTERETNTGRVLDKEVEAVTLATLANRGDAQKIAFGFDIPQSPIGKFIFEQSLHEPGRVKKLSEETFEVFAPERNTTSAQRHLAADQLLESYGKILGKEVLSAIAKSLASVAFERGHPGRGDALYAYANELSKSMCVQITRE